VEVARRAAQHGGSEVRIMQRVGPGTSGYPRDVAVKCLHQPRHDLEERWARVNEVAPCFALLPELDLLAGEVVQVTEYCESLALECPSTGLIEHAAWAACASLQDGLSKGLRHGAVHARNLFWGPRGHILLDWSARCHDSGTVFRNAHRTIQQRSAAYDHLAPEFFANVAAVTERSETWSLGMLLHSFLCDTRLFSADCDRLEQIKDGRFSRGLESRIANLVGEGVSLHLLALMRDCLQSAPDLRPDLLEFTERLCRVY
jgi:hypothetical protein